MSPSPTPPPERRVLPVLRRVALHIYSTRLPQMAAALSYRTIFSLIPILIVGLVVLKFFTTEQDLSGMVARALDYAGLADIKVADRAQDEAAFFLDPGAFGPPAPGQAWGRAEGAEGEAAPAVSAELDDWIERLVARVSTISFRAIGIVGLLTLVYAAVSMLVEVEGAFNQIYRAPAGRSWGRRFAQYWTMLSLGPVFLVATFVVSERFTTWAARLDRPPAAVAPAAPGEGAAPGGGGAGRAEGAAPGVGGGPRVAAAEPAPEVSHSLLIRLAGFAITVCITTALLFFLYVTVPNTRVRWRPALIGAAIGAVLWESSKWGFTTYLAFSATYARFYGVLALIPLFVLWVYVTWMVVLFGLQAAYAIQHLGAFTAEEKAPGDGPRVVDPAAMVGVVGAVARSFAAGRPAARDWVANQTGLVDSLAATMLERLAAAGLLHRVAGEGASEAYTLARPPGAIGLDEVLGVAHELSGPAEAAGPREVVERLRRVERDAMSGLTAASLVEPPGGTAATPGGVEAAGAAPGAGEAPRAGG